MSQAGKRSALVVVGAVVVVGAIGGLDALFYARSGAPQAQGTSGARGQDEANAVPRAELEHDPHAADIVTHTERGSSTVPVPETVMASIANALAEHLGRSNVGDAAIADARAGRIDALEMGRKLREAVAGHPEIGHGILKEMAQERTASLSMQMAQALATVEDDPTLRKETIDTLRAAPPETRAVGLLALMGRGEPDALQLAADTFAKDTPEARGTAGFLLNNAPNGLDGKMAEQALASARAALQDPSAGARAREESTTMLGREGAPDSDVTILEGIALGDGDANMRGRALASLDQTGADRTRLRVTFDRVARDPNAPEQLVTMAKTWLATHP